MNKINGDWIETHYVSDCQGKLQTEITGHFQRLSKTDKPIYCLVSGDFDIETIGELIEAAGYTKESVRGKRVKISINEEDV